jgi:hypothetical protein
MLALTAQIMCAVDLDRNLHFESYFDIALKLLEDISSLDHTYIHRSRSSYSSESSAQKQLPYSFTLRDVS